MVRISTLAIAVSVNLLGAVACKRPADKQQPRDDVTCSKPSDCPSDESCVFEAGCAAPRGTCKRELDHCKTNTPICTCAGKTLLVCDATEPFEHAGACRDSGAAR
jgi:hypothetical protein